MTARVVCRLFIAFAFVELFTSCSVYSRKTVHSRGSIAENPTQSALVRACRRIPRDDYGRRMGLYLDAAREALDGLKRDPNGAAAQANYRFAVGRVIEHVVDHDLKPWQTRISCPSASGEAWRLGAPYVRANPDIDPNDFLVRVSDRFSFKGKLVGERSLKDGAGAPVVVTNKGVDGDELFAFAPGKKVYRGRTAVIEFDGRDANVRLVDPLSVETVTLDGTEMPLAADFQAPLALGMAELDPVKTQLGGLLEPADYAQNARLGMLQTYDPEKTPVLMIHGLGNSAATWAPLIEHLQAQADIRADYQFLFFSYPSGLPYPMIAAILRQKLEEFDRYYPDHRDFVVIGHSMGGMIARLLLTDSEMELWDLFYARPPSEIGFSPATLEIMEPTLIFEPLDNIGRVIFCSASHRGSDIANGVLGKIGIRLIGDPISQSNVTRESLSKVRPEIELNGRKTRDRNHLPNSIEVLNPESPWLLTVDRLPLEPGIPYHSVIGDRGKGGNLSREKPCSSDGVVPYWSSHLDGAESEKIVPSDHWSHLHPEGRDEIERILRDYSP